MRNLLLLFLPVLTLCLLAGAPAHARTELTLAIKGEPSEGFDPVLGWGRYGAPLFQSTLLARDNDLNIVNELATDVDVSQGGTVWTVTIRKDAVFSDGHPLDAEDVAFTFNTAAESGGKVDLTMLERAEATGPHTVVFTLARPDSTFQNRLITTGIVPAHAYGPDYARKPVGSGPYMLTSWVEGEQMIAEVNPHWYGEAPAFTRLTFLYAGEDTSFAAARAGEVQLVVVPQHLANSTLANMRMHAVKSVDNRGIMFPYMPDDGKTTDRGAPIGNDVTSDLAIRKAVNIAVNREALVAGVLDGHGRPAWFVCDGLPWDNPENRMQDNRPEEAAQLLTDAGWTDTDGDGIREKMIDGTRVPARFTLWYPADRSIRQGLALAVAQMLEPLGIAVEVRGGSWDAIRGRSHADAVLFGWGAHDPTEIYQLYHSKGAGQGWNNRGFYANPTVDKLLDAARAQPSLAEAIPYWQRAQWNGQTGAGPRGDAPWAWLVNLDHTYFVHDCLDVGDSRIEPHGHGWPITANITEWQWTCN